MPLLATCQCTFCQHGRGRTSTVADPPSTTVLATTILKTAPAGKSEPGIAGIKHLDANMGAMAAHIEDHIMQFHEHVVDVKADLTLTCNQLKSFAADAVGLAVSSSFTAEDMLEHPIIRALVTSNNASIGTIDVLCAEVTFLTSPAANMRDDHCKCKHDNNTSMYSEDVFFPAVKQVTHASNITSTVTPAYNNIPTAPPPISYVDPTPSAAPGSIPDAPPPISTQRTTGAVDIRPINWGKDISGQVHSLIGCMSCGKNIDADAVKNVYAKCFPKNNKFVTTYFPTNVAAIQFVNRWEAAPSAGYKKTQSPSCWETSGGRKLSTKTWTLTNNFHLWAKLCKYPNSFKDPWGSVLCLVSDVMHPHLHNDLSGPDLLVLEFNEFFIINGYILPEQSSSDSFADYHPWLKYNKTMALLQLTGKDRGGSQVIQHISADVNKPILTRGTTLVRMCEDHNLKILNGNSTLGPNNSGYTSFQPQGETVVNYAIANSTAISQIKSFKILKHDPGQSDHCALVLELRPKAIKWKPSSMPQAINTHNQPHTIGKLPNATELDRLFITMLNSKLMPQQKITKLFGPPRQHRSGGRSLLGLNHPWNEAAHVPDAQTNNCGEVYTILCVLQRAYQTQTLHIWSDSEYAMETITICAPDEASCGGKAQTKTYFETYGNRDNNTVDLLAKRGTLMLVVPDTQNSLKIHCKSVVLSNAKPKQSKGHGTNMDHTSALTMHRNRRLYWLCNSSTAKNR
ncbi:hypothetical protein B0H19DRAFT_1062526 [Mycena capillaripes]|nr:hypothetical protein B0H19DRAFT_1062526 [Mycena capillaripes]